MTATLNAVKAFQNPELIATLAKSYSESEVGIAKTLNGITPTLLMGLLAKCGDSHSIDPLFQALRDFDDGIIDQPDRLLNYQAGAIKGTEPFLTHLFGAKIPAISNALAAFSAVKPATAYGLMGLMAPLVMGVLKRQIQAESLTSHTLTTLLLRQKTTLLGLLPATVAAMLGETNAGLAENRFEGLKWLWPMLLLLALGVALIFYLKG